METTIKITENQKHALELVKELADQGKITASEAIVLIIGIYENEKETVYIPYQFPDPSPYPYQPWTIDPNTTTPITAPWWDQQKIYCESDFNNANSINQDKNTICPFNYSVSNTNSWRW